MVVVVLTACPVGLRGDLTRWLLEIAPGVFVGNVSSRVRNRLWERVESLVKDGRAIMAYSTNNEQRMAFKVHQPDWQPVDVEGIELIKRPKGTEDSTLIGPPKKGWSNAKRHHRAHKFGG